jgi:hypothetical protein
MRIPPTVPISSGMLAVSYAPDPTDEQSFWSWYASERIPALLECPGFLGATSYVAAETWVREPGGGLVPLMPPLSYLTVFNLSDVDALKSDAYLDATHRSYSEQYPTVDGRPLRVSRKFSIPARGISRMDNPPAELDPSVQRGLLFVSLTPEPDWEEKTAEWYDTMHLPELLSCPGFIGAHRHRAVDGLPNLLALYDLASVDTLRTDEFRAMSGRPYEALQPLAREASAHRTRNISATYQEIAHSGQRMPGPA